MYPLTFYTDKFVPANAGACARGPVIFIRPKYRNDVGLYEHELMHVKQWVFSLGLHSFLYLLSKRYRLWSEVQAYQKQLEYSPQDINLFAKFIAENYGLKITQEEAKELVT